jgi:hypothetical protein
MSLNFYKATNRTHGDYVANVSSTMGAFAPSGVGSLYYSSATATMDSAGSGTTYAASLITSVYIQTVKTDVDAVMTTIDVIPENNILSRQTVDQIYLKTGISENSIEIYKHTDFFTQENTAIKTVCNLYNDGQEVNSAVNTAVFGGSRSNIVHSDLPIGSGDQKGFSLTIKATNEAQIHALKILTSDENIGGDR